MTTSVNSCPLVGGRFQPRDPHPAPLEAEGIQQVVSVLGFSGIPQALSAPRGGAEAGSEERRREASGRQAWGAGRAAGTGEGQRAGERPKDGPGPRKERRGGDTHRGVIQDDVAAGHVAVEAELLQVLDERALGGGGGRQRAARSGRPARPPPGGQGGPCARLQRRLRVRPAPTRGTPQHPAPGHLPPDPSVAEDARDLQQALAGLRGAGGRQGTSSGAWRSSSGQ